jgi:ribosomal protein S1
MASKSPAWDDLKKRLPIGSRVSCKVVLHRPYGVHTKIDGIDFEGLIQITDCKDKGRMTPEEYPPLDSEIEAVVLGFKDSGMQVWLGIKPSQLLM